jgi:hypothetical protein
MFNKKIWSCGTKNNTFHIYGFYTVDGGGFKLNSLHIQKEVDSKFKNLLGFQIQIRKLFILPQFFTNKRRSPQSTD